MDRIKENLIDDDSVDESIPNDKPGRGRPKGSTKVPANKNQTREDVSTMISTIHLVVVATMRLQEEVKPTDEEIGALSVPMSKIILRHVNLSGKITGDVLDTFAIIAAVTSWYSRVTPYLQASRQPVQYEQPQPHAQPTPESPVSDADLIMAARSPQAYNFLESVRVNSAQAAQS